MMKNPQFRKRIPGFIFICIVSLVFVLVLFGESKKSTTRDPVRGDKSSLISVDETAAPSRPVVRELPPEPTTVPTTVPTTEPTTYPHTAWAGIDPERIVYVSDRSGTVHSTSTCSGMKHYSACPAYEAYHTHRPLCEHCWSRDILFRNK